MKMKSLNKKNKKKIFQIITLKGCFSCDEAKKLLKKKGYKINLLELEFNNEEEKQFWNNIVKTKFKKNHMTFPKIFSEGKFIGGYDQLKVII